MRSRRAWVGIVAAFAVLATIGILVDISSLWGSDLDHLTRSLAAIRLAENPLVFGALGISLGLSVGLVAGAVEAYEEVTTR